jgi:hypothetical protein
MKVLVTGSRDWSSIDVIVRELSKLPTGSIIVHGACRGADTIAGVVAEALGFEVRPYPASWNEFARSAGPIRNRYMLCAEHKRNEPVDLVIAFHADLENSTGTKDMVGIATVANIECRVITG